MRAKGKASAKARAKARPTATIVGSRDTSGFNAEGVKPAFQQCCGANTGKPSLSKVGTVDFSRPHQKMGTKTTRINELEHANPATPCNVDQKSENNARSDETKGRNDANRDRLKPSTSGTASVTVTAGTDRRWQVTTPMTARHSQVLTSRSTELLLRA